MPSSKSTSDKKGSLSSRRLSLTRRASSESTKSPLTKIPSLPPARHGLDVPSETAAHAQLVAMPDQSHQQHWVDRPSSLPESPSAVLNAAFASPTSSHGLPSPRMPGDSPEGRTSGRETGKGSADPVSAIDRSPGLTESQIQLNIYRDRLARDLEKRELASRGLLASPAEKLRVSPIQEESTTSPPAASSSGPTTATSTESGNTIRGGYTPGPIAGTPSYPFPRMATTPGFAPGYMQRPFNNTSPSTYNFMSHAMSLDSFAAQDKVLSGSSTPASALTFHPSGAAPCLEGSDFPTPNLYDLSLILSAEPGLDAWWSTVVQIMRDVYKAERVTLAIPADSTDIENVPWGQKATYNEHEEDELSLAYLARGSSIVPSSTDEFPGESPVLDDAHRLRPSSRPSLQSRHSFTTYEDNKASRAATDEPVTSKRPSFLARSKSYFPPGQTPIDLKRENSPELNQTSLAQHDAREGDKTSNWEAPLDPPPLVKGRILPMLQALDFEADPLIDHAGVTRVLDRGKVIALTRSYPYLQNQPHESSSKVKGDAKGTNQTSKKQPKKPRGDSAAKLSTLLGNANAPRIIARSMTSVPSERSKPSSIISRLDQEQAPPLPPQYEEYEQAPPSPWSQSPAPSPAVRPEPKENPFFADATVDEDSFNPGSAPADYVGMRPPEAIGVENSWTVLHIPLTHLLLSKPTSTHPFRLDATVLEQKFALKAREAKASSAEPRFGSPSPEGAPRNDKPHPIAILSILSPIIPYPSNLRHSLEHLGPHLATSFSIARHYSNLEIELAGLQRRRPQTAGFGGLATDGRPLADPTIVASFNYGLPDDMIAQPSLTGSITSPSDYSGLSKSAAGSPSGTPGWDQGSLSMIIDKRQGASPAQMSSSGDSYFSTKQRLSASATDSSSASGSQKPRGGSKEASPVDKRLSRKSGADSEQHERLDDRPAAYLEKYVSLKELKVAREDDLTGKARAQDPKTPDQQHRHTQLHSYGADFATSFQSLPPSSSVTSRPVPHTTSSRAGSLQMGAADMPPPSDRLKGLMLDALPAHVFVSLPQTGEVVWVNSRYLTYRGQTVADLAADPWGSIHPEDRDEYLKAWSHSLRTGEQFSRTVRIKRFDGVYRWFYARAVASRDKRGVLMQFLGSYMDIHDQHIAELKAARQEEIEASEAKHRLLANLIPQIIFTATEDEGITFANDQWLSYTGQSFNDCLGLGFMDFVHSEDLAKCKIPADRPPTPVPKSPANTKTANATVAASPPNTPKSSKGKGSEVSIRGVHQALSRNNSSSSGSVYEMPTTDLSELARKGVIKVATDSNGRLSYTTEVRLRSKAGEYRWHLIRCVEIDNIDFGSGASSFFGSATDINDHKLLEAKLKEAMESKSRFLSNMSHEIRTPLIGISGMVSFLQDTVLNEEQRDYTNTIQTSANSLLMIINDILDLSKVDAGMMKLKYEWFHTRALIEDVNELVSTMAIAKRLELNYVVEADVPTWVKGDKVRIRQVLLNVIGNAIKFTSEGEVFSRCRIFTGDTSALEENEIALEFAIIDTGRGFSKEEAELIFKPFSQIDGSSTRQHGGSGLGLVISRQLVELHGGKMEGSAVPGEGSTFTFTARFTLPTPEDHPDPPISPLAIPVQTEPQHDLNLPPPGYKALPPSKPLTPKTSPAAQAGVSSLASSGSSDPSIHSSRSQMTERSSISSINVGLVHFSEAARASGQDLSQMKLELPQSDASSNSTPTHDSNKTLSPPQDFRPPMYSILIICPQTHSREATAQHIEQTLPKDVPHQITALESVEQADKLIGGDDPVHFTHIVLNLPSPESLMAMMDRIQRSVTADKTAILVLSDTGQRQAVVKLAADANQEELVSEERVTFINKPVKPSRFAVIFDPDKMRDSSIDRNRSTAQRMVESQKQSYQEIEKRMGNKGYKVLLVEDNPVNQKVLQKYLKKVGVQVDVAADGVECTDMVLSRAHEYYSLILCDLHMPRKDGYQACREIRQWEQENSFGKLPIIALSANVMSDVQDKCVSAGFSDYVTKPVDFIDLSRAMSKFF